VRLILYIVSIIIICALVLTGYLAYGLYSATTATMVGIGALIASTLVYMAAQRTARKPQADVRAPNPGGEAVQPKREFAAPRRNHSGLEFEMTPFPADSTAEGRMRLFEDHLSMGRNLIRSERYTEAVEILNKAVELEPENSKTYNYLGIALGRQQRYEESAAAYQKAISVDYDYASAHFNLALVYEQMDRRHDALECWKRYVDIGEVTGEREDMLERARARIKELS